MNARLLRRFLVVAILGLFLVATLAPVGAQDQELPRNETLYVGGFQWAPITTFNPLTSGAGWPANCNGNTYEYIYQTLFGFNLATGALDPMLAKDLTFSDPATAVITLQDGTKWQDGEALTTDDVLFSFGLGKGHDDIYYSTFWNYVTDMKATGDRTIQVDLNKDSLNAGLVKQYLAVTCVLPQHIWAERAKGDTLISQVVDTAPVGSGPYKLKTYSDERVVVERDDSYWGIAAFGTPAPKYVVHPIFKSNDDGNLALQSGQLDVSQQFVPQIWQMWQDKKLPVGTWFKDEPYYLPGNIPLLWINTHKPGLDNPLVRRALAFAINYPQIAATAMSKYSAPAQSSLILPSGGESKFFDADQVKALGWSYDPDKAKSILENDLKATKGDDGVYTLPDGTRLGPWIVQATFGWTDWDTAVELVAQSAQEAGFDITVKNPEFPVINADRNNGNFDMLIWTPTGSTPATPWQRFRDALDIRGVADVGQAAYWNWGRYSNPDVAALLDKVATETDEAKLIDMYAQLDKIFMTDIPAIPLMYRPLEFYEFNESVWTGFPTSESAGGTPQQMQAGIKLLYMIKPK